MRRNVRQIVTSAIVAGVGLTLVAGALSAAPLNDELRVLLTSHPQIRSAENTSEAARYGIEEADCAFYPTMALSGDTGAERTDSPARRATGEDAFSIRRDKLTLTVTQNLFNGYRDDAGSKAATYSAREAQMSLYGTRMNLLFEGVSKYLDVLLNVRLIEIARQNESTIQTQLELEDERVQRGSGITVDVAQAKSRLQVAKQERVLFEGNLKAALARYKQLFGHIPEPSDLQDARPDPGLAPASLEEAVQLGLKQNPQLLLVRFRSDAARERKRVAKADYFPSLDLVGTLDYQDNNGSTRDIEREQSLLLKANWEFFSGFKTRARVEAAARAYAATNDDYNFASRRIEEDVEIAFAKLETDVKRVELLQNAVNIAEEVFIARAKLREAGKGAQLDVLDAQSEVFSAKLNLIKADYDSRIAVYRLAQATGSLTPQRLNVAVK
ncbi:MAG: TolC family outer membrane protein [Rhodospirillaceae bacterium]|nr:TolC family outer membrane protein [Rhodospirillaceae bacterium]